MKPHARLPSLGLLGLGALGLAWLAACTPPGQTAAPPSSGAAATPDPGGPQRHPTPCAAVPVPDTPVGERTAALLEAVDGGDPARLEALVAEHFAPSFQQRVPLERHVEVLRGFHDQTGGVVVCRVEHGSTTEALLLLGAERGDGLHLLSVSAEETAPHRISRISLEPASPQALEQPPAPLDDAARHAVIEEVAQALDDYVFADVAAAMQQRIRAERDAGHYASLTHRWPLARRLTEDLRAVSHDEHLTIRYFASPLPPAPSEPPGDGPTPEQIEEARAAAASDGFGLAKVEVLDGNVGYVDLRLFHPVQVAREAITEAMTTIADTKALIVDLRHNHGGDPATVAFMTSYLFGDRKVHLNDLYFRRTDETIELWTDPSVPGKRFGERKPVFVLVSGETFSGGEEFAYNLRALKRATLIGETTGGGAHPVDGVRVDDHLLAFVPVGRAINPITKGNWEGTGVKPHVEVPASEALSEALQRIGRGNRARP